MELEWLGRSWLAFRWPTQAMPIASPQMEALRHLPSLSTAARVNSIPLDPLLLSKCTGTKPIVCAFDVPANGNYTVTVELGSASAASKSRVQAETYRISVPTVSLAAGSYAKYTFGVNVRKEIHDGYGFEFGVKEKELNLLIDDGAEASGGTPALHGVGFRSTPDLPTIFVAGDSTLCDWEPTYAATKAGPLERGWAQEFSQFLKPGIAVANYADSGEMAGGFYDSRFWKPAKALIREGDYVFIEFGHNDQGDVTESQFSTNMLRYVTDARAVKATPILFTPVARKGATDADHGFAGLDEATRSLAVEREGHPSRFNEHDARVLQDLARQIGRVRDRHRRHPLQRKRRDPSLQAGG